MTRPAKSVSASALPLFILFIVIGAALPVAARAGNAVVSPLLGRNVDPMVLLNVTSLVSSELAFMNRFAEVEQLEMLPARMNASCLGRPSCLGSIAKATGSRAVVAGSLTGRGGSLDLLLVYYDGGRIIRKKSFSLPNVPSVIADGMGAYVKELVTGRSAQDEAEAESLGDFGVVSEIDLLDETGDFEIAPGADATRPGASFEGEPSVAGGDLDEALDEIDFAPAASQIQVTRISCSSVLSLVPSGPHRPPPSHPAPSGVLPARSVVDLDEDDVLHPTSDRQARRRSRRRGVATRRSDRGRSDR